MCVYILQSNSDQINTIITLKWYINQQNKIQEYRIYIYGAPNFWFYKKNTHQKKSKGFNKLYCQKWLCMCKKFSSLLLTIHKINCKLIQHLNLYLLFLLSYTFLSSTLPSSPLNFYPLQWHLHSQFTQEILYFLLPG